MAVLMEHLFFKMHSKHTQGHQIQPPSLLLRLLSRNHKPRRTQAACCHPRTSSVAHWSYHSLGLYLVLSREGHRASQVALVGTCTSTEPVCQCRRRGRRRFDPWVGNIAGRREWQPSPVFLPGKSHGQRSLVGYSPWGCKESDTTEAT